MQKTTERMEGQMKHTPMRILSALLAAALLIPAMLPARAADSLQDALTAPSVRVSVSPALTPG